MSSSSISTPVPRVQLRTTIPPVTDVPVISFPQELAEEAEAIFNLKSLTSFVSQPHVLAQAELLSRFRSTFADVEMSDELSIHVLRYLIKLISTPQASMFVSHIVLIFRALGTSKKSSILFTELNNWLYTYDEKDSRDDDSHMVLILCQLTDVKPFFYEIVSRHPETYFKIMNYLTQMILSSISAMFEVIKTNNFSDFTIIPSSQISNESVSLINNISRKITFTTRLLGSLVESSPTELFSALDKQPLVTLKLAIEPLISLPFEAVSFDLVIAMSVLYVVITAQLYNYFNRYEGLLAELRAVVSDFSSGFSQKSVDLQLLNLPYLTEKATSFISSFSQGTCDKQTSMALCLQVHRIPYINGISLSRGFVTALPHRALLDPLDGSSRNLMFHFLPQVIARGCVQGSTTSRLSSLLSLDSLLSVMHKVLVGGSSASDGTVFSEIPIQTLQLVLKTVLTCWESPVRKVSVSAASVFDKILEILLAKLSTTGSKSDQTLVQLVDMVLALPPQLPSRLSALLKCMRRIPEYLISPYHLFPVVADFSNSNSNSNSNSTALTVQANLLDSSFLEPLFETMGESITLAGAAGTLITQTVASVRVFYERRFGMLEGHYMGQHAWYPAVSEELARQVHALHVKQLEEIESLSNLKGDSETSPSPLAKKRKVDASEAEDSGSNPSNPSKKEGKKAPKPKSKALKLNLRPTLSDIFLAAAPLIFERSPRGELLSSLIYCKPSPHFGTKPYPGYSSDASHVPYSMTNVMPLLVSLLSPSLQNGTEENEVWSGLPFPNPNVPNDPTNFDAILPLLGIPEESRSILSFLRRSTLVCIETTKFFTDIAIAHALHPLRHHRVRILNHLFREYAVQDPLNLVLLLRKVHDYVPAHFARMDKKQPGEMLLNALTEGDDVLGLSERRLWLQAGVVNHLRGYGTISSLMESSILVHLGLLPSSSQYSALHATAPAEEMGAHCYDSPKSLLSALGSADYDTKGFVLELLICRKAVLSPFNRFDAAWILRWLYSGVCKPSSPDHSRRTAKYVGLVAEKCCGIIVASLKVAHKRLNPVDSSPLNPLLSQDPTLFSLENVSDFFDSKEIIEHPNLESNSILAIHCALLAAIYHCLLSQLVPGVSPDRSAFVSEALCALQRQIRAHSVPAAAGDAASALKMAESSSLMTRHISSTLRRCVAADGVSVTAAECLWTRAAHLPTLSPPNLDLVAAQLYTLTASAYPNTRESAAEALLFISSPVEEAFENGGRGLPLFQSAGGLAQLLKFSLRLSQSVRDREVDAAARLLMMVVDGPILRDGYGISVQFDGEIDQPKEVKSLEGAGRADCSVTVISPRPVVLPAQSLQKNSDKNYRIPASASPEEKKAVAEAAILRLSNFYLSLLRLLRARLGAFRRALWKLLGVSAEGVLSLALSQGQNDSALTQSLLTIKKTLDQESEVSTDVKGDPYYSEDDENIADVAPVAHGLLLALNAIFSRLVSLFKEFHSNKDIASVSVYSITTNIEEKSSVENSTEGLDFPRILNETLAALSRAHALAQLVVAGRDERDGNSGRAAAPTIITSMHTESAASTVTDEPIVLAPEQTKSSEVGLLRSMPVSGGNASLRREFHSNAKELTSNSTSLVEEVFVRDAASFVASKARASGLGSAENKGGDEDDEMDADMEEFGGYDGQDAVGDSAVMGAGVDNPGSDRAHLLIVFSWHLSRSVVTFMATVVSGCELVEEINETCTIRPALEHSSVEAIGDLLLDSLFRIKHIGSIHCTGESLENIAKTLVGLEYKKGSSDFSLTTSTQDSLPLLPIRWLRVLVQRLLSRASAQFILRRSAGFSISFLSILRALSSGASTAPRLPILTAVFSLLLLLSGSRPRTIIRDLRSVQNAANDSQEDSSTSDSEIVDDAVSESELLKRILAPLLDALPLHEREDPSNSLIAFANAEAMGSVSWRTRVHAMNILRLLYRDSRLGLLVSLHTPTALRCCFDGFDSPAWAVRNSSMMLYAAVIERVGGQGISIDTDPVIRAPELMHKKPQVVLQRIHTIIESLGEIGEVEEQKNLLDKTKAYWDAHVLATKRKGEHDGPSVAALAARYPSLPDMLVSSLVSDMSQNSLEDGMEGVLKALGGSLDKYVPRSPAVYPILLLLARLRPTYFASASFSQSLTSTSGVQAGAVDAAARLREALLGPSVPQIASTKRVLDRFRIGNCSVDEIFSEFLEMKHQNECKGVLTLIAAHPHVFTRMLVSRAVVSLLPSGESARARIVPTLGHIVAAVRARQFNGVHGLLMTLRSLISTALSSNTGAQTFCATDLLDSLILVMQTLDSLFNLGIRLPNRLLNSLDVLVDPIDAPAMSSIIDILTDIVYAYLPLIDVLSEGEGVIGGAARILEIFEIAHAALFHTSVLSLQEGAPAFSLFPSESNNNKSIFHKVSVNTVIGLPQLHRRSSQAIAAITTLLLLHPHRSVLFKRTGTTSDSLYIFLHCLSRHPVREARLGMAESMKAILKHADTYIALSHTPSPASASEPVLSCTTVGCASAAAVALGALPVSVASRLQKTLASSLSCETDAETLSRIVYSVLNALRASLHTPDTAIPFITFVSDSFSNLFVTNTDPSQLMEQDRDQEVSGSPKKKVLATPLALARLLEAHATAIQVMFQKLDMDSGEINLVESLPQIEALARSVQSFVALLERSALDMSSHCLRISAAHALHVSGLLRRTLLLPASLTQTSSLQSLRVLERARSSVLRTLVALAVDPDDECREYARISVEAFLHSRINCDSHFVIQNTSTTSGEGHTACNLAGYGKEAVASYNQLVSGLPGTIRNLVTQLYSVDGDDSHFVVTESNAPFIAMYLMATTRFQSDPFSPVASTSLETLESPLQFLANMVSNGLTSWQLELRSISTTVKKHMSLPISAVVESSDFDASMMDRVMFNPDPLNEYAEPLVLISVAAAILACSGLCDTAELSKRISHIKSAIQEADKGLIANRENSIESGSSVVAALPLLAEEEPTFLVGSVADAKGVFTASVIAEII